MLDADAPAGLIDSAITLGQAASPQGPVGSALVIGSGPATALPIDTSSMPAASLPIQGTVKGDLSAQPATVVFGTVAARSSASVQISISSRSQQNLAALTFTADRPWLSAKVVGPAGSPGLWTIRLSIAATAPAGAQNAHLIGTARSGERLVIPVMAYIVAEGL
jgi:hypothetical protein